MKCRWIDDRCQHGYWIDEAEVTFDTETRKFSCPKGQDS